MRHPTTHLLIAILAFAGCSKGEPSALPSGSQPPIVSSDLQDDLWHAHRHVHDGVQVHDHEHTPDFVGGHEHTHGHAHRHPETELGGIVVSLQRQATPGQLPGGAVQVPRGPHLEILPGLPSAFTFCLLSEAERKARSKTVSGGSGTSETPNTNRNSEPDAGAALQPKTGESQWVYWNPTIDEIIVTFQVEGTDYSIKCKRNPSEINQPHSTEGIFGSILPENLRERLRRTTARLRVSKLMLELGDARLRVSEQLYFQGEELSVFLQ